MKIVYSDGYDLHVPLLDHLHRFDGRKYSRAYAVLQERFGADALRHVTHSPVREVAEADLLLVHTADYLESLNSGAVLAHALEVPPLRFVPASIRHQRLLSPMRLAVQGTIDSAELALTHGLAYHLGGGFHHAFRDHGEGFCVYADAAIAIHSLRSRKLLLDTDKILVIDLDAHRGNGCEQIFESDSTVQFLDIYNFQIYPGPLDADELQAPYMIPIKAQTSDEEYLQTLNEALPRFLADNAGAKLAIYNAGTDILAGDPLGRLAVSEGGTLKRDRIVLEALAERNIPSLVLTSGGYTARSYAVIAESIAEALQAELTAKP